MAVVETVGWRQNEYSSLLKTFARSLKILDLYTNYHYHTFINSELIVREISQIRSSLKKRTKSVRYPIRRRRIIRQICSALFYYYLRFKTLCSCWNCQINSPDGRLTWLRNTTLIDSIVMHSAVEKPHNGLTNHSYMNHPPCHNFDRVVDKTDYCWNWLLYSADQEASPISDHQNSVENAPEWDHLQTKGMSADDEMGSKSCLRSTMHWFATDNQLKEQNQERQLLVHEDRGLPESTGRSSSESENISSGAQDITSYSNTRDPLRALPYHVTRRTESRQPNHHHHHHHHCIPSSLDKSHPTLVPNQNRLLRRNVRSVRTPWLSVRTENIFDQDLRSAFSHMTLCTDIEQPRCHSSSYDHSQSIQFLTNISPVMNMLPPPNHNPFAKNESI